MQVFESEQLVKNLKKFNLKTFGSKEWLVQQQSLSKLNVQAHLNVQQNNEEFITELILNENKLPILVNELVLSEIWTAKVLPEILKVDKTKLDYLQLYVMLFNQVTCINLLETILYSKRAVLALEDNVLDLIDYCARKIAVLNSWEASDFADDLGNTPKDAKSLLAETEIERLSQQRKECAFDCAISSLSALRYITDHVTDISFGAMSRLLTIKDIPSSLVVLLEKAPWLRMAKNKEIYRYSASRWKKISRDDVAELDKIEAQVWLALYNLLVEPECRKIYRFHKKNHETILRLKAYLTDQLKAQLPMLESLHRSVEEVQLIVPADEADTAKHGLIVELLPELYTELLAANVDDIVKLELANPLINPSIVSSKQGMNALRKDKMDMAAAMAEIYDLHQLDSLLEDPVCATCGKSAVNRCSRCKSEWYCGRPCQVKSWSKHKSVCDTLFNASRQVGPEPTSSTSEAAKKDNNLIKVLY